MSSQGRIRRRLEAEAIGEQIIAEWPKHQERVTKLEAQLEALSKAIVNTHARVLRIDYRFWWGKVRKWRDKRMMARKMAEREEAARKAAAEQEARQLAEAGKLPDPVPDVRGLLS